ncbi:MAG: FAD-dependent oxidoreductase, partial [Burkholderiales bacterium]
MKIAVIGSGISGLSAAWLLSSKHSVTLFEADDRLGGHTNTVDVTLDGTTYPVDTGFLVFNDRTYPNLVQLFELLGVRSAASDMSFSFRMENNGLEWAGTNLASVFAQKRNLLRPNFLRMVKEIVRFNRETTALLEFEPAMNGTLAEYLDENRYSEAFRNWYLLP